MTITFGAVAGLIIGIVLGGVGAGLAVMEQRSRHWIVCLRLPGELHRRLREEATVAGWSLKAEIISRLQASFSQPNGDQVVDAPRLLD
jgi:hypothetical protein